MPIYPRGDSFMVSVGSGAGRVRETYPTKELAEAREAVLLAQRKGHKAPGVVTLGNPAKTLQDAYDLAYRTHWKGSKGERTSTMNARTCLAFFGPKTPVCEINPGSVEDYIAEMEDLGNTGATINKKLSTLNVMLKEAQRMGWAPNRVLILRRKESSKRLYWYTEEEERDMIDAAHKLGLPVLADFIVWSIDTGFRRSESLRFKVEDFQGGMLRLHDGETKSDTGRTIPATPAVAAMVEKAREAGHTRVFQGLTDNKLRGMWANMREFLGKSEDPKYIVHVLRHTTATRLAAGGYSASQIQAYMGHSAIQTSMRYIHLCGKDLIGAAAILARKGTKPVLRVVNGGAV